MELIHITIDRLQDTLVTHGLSTDEAAMLVAEVTKAAQAEEFECLKRGALDPRHPSPDTYPGSLYYAPG